MKGFTRQIEKIRDVNVLCNSFTTSLGFLLSEEKEIQSNEMWREIILFEKWQRIITGN